MRYGGQEESHLLNGVSLEPNRAPAHKERYILLAVLDL